MYALRYIAGLPYYLVPLKGFFIHHNGKCCPLHEVTCASRPCSQCSALFWVLPLFYQQVARLVITVCDHSRPISLLISASWFLMILLSPTRHLIYTHMPMTSTEHLICQSLVRRILCEDKLGLLSIFVRSCRTEISTMCYNLLDLHYHILSVLSQPAAMSRPDLVWRNRCGRTFYDYRGVD